MITNLVLFGCVILLFISNLKFSFGQDVFSCGGFIKSAVPITYANIMIRLYTPEGHLKYETDCAPNNGYYMIPVYSKGTYLLKVDPPTGWEFEPESIELVVDGVNDPCTKGKDINFEFRGFSVVGKVRNKGSTNGPANFNVGLFLNAADTTPSATTKTETNGKYVFKGVTSGKYYVKSLESLSCVENTLVEVVVSEKPVAVSADLEIYGYTVWGFVRNEKQPVSKAGIFLYTKEKLPFDVKSCKKELQGVQTPTAPDKFQFLCATTSADDGKFEFTCVPPGVFSLISVYKTDEIMFDLAPSSIAFAVSDKHVELKDSFEVKGFSVGGRVLWTTNGQGVSNAKVSVDGRQVATTDDRGMYLLKQISSGKHKIEINLIDVEFSTLDVELSPKNHKIADVVAKKFNVCGKVSFHSFPSTVPKLTQRKLLLTNEGTKEVSSITTEQDGSFCRMVSPDVYNLEPQILANEKQAGLTLIPKNQKISVVDRPLKDISFNQFEAKISGAIRCLSVCKKVRVSLNYNGQELSTVNLAIVQPSANFEFKKLLPGKYTVKVSGDGYCWDKNQNVVVVENADVESVNFLQNGFAVSVTSSNDAKLTFTSSSNAAVSGVFNLKKGSNAFCLPSDGIYDLKLESCHKFDKEIYKYNTGQPAPLILSSTKHLVSGFVSTKEHVDDLKMMIKSSKSSESFAVGPLKSDELNNNETKSFTYRFEYFAENGEEFEISPKSSIHLYEPTFRRFVVQDDCVTTGVTFVGERGLFLNGNIKPTLSGVNILMKHKKDDQLQFSTVTGADGTYTIGPLRTFDGFAIIAERAGYVFSPVANQFGHFLGAKLSELTLKTLDFEGRALSGVLLSLSGKENYRSNNITEENGSITFVGLTPGDYYIKPIYKEYSFEPATKIVEIKEGSTVSVELVGKRVAYSCVGSVRHLAGQTVPNVGIEAFSSNCNQMHEESSTGDDGTFKIRGLQPNCEYVLQLKPGQKLPSTIPKKHILRVTNEDIFAKDLILKPEVTTMELTGRVECDRSLLPHLKVVLYKETVPDTPLHTVHFHTASVFFLPSVNIDNTAYVARLDSTLNPNEYLKTPSPEISFKANQTFQYLHFEFNPKKKAAEAEIFRGGYIALPVTIIIMLLAYNYDKVLPILQDWLQIGIKMAGQTQATLQRTSSSAAMASTSASAEVAGDTNFDSTFGKKKMKARKT